MITISTLEEIEAVVDPETVLLDSRVRSYQWSLTTSGEGWCSVDDPTPITSGHLQRFGPLKVLHCTVSDAEPAPLDVTSEQQAAAKRLTPLLTEDGDWLVDPESAQFHADIATLLRMAGVEPIRHTY